MGINLVPDVGNFSIQSVYFQRKDSSDLVPEGVISVKNGSVEEGCAPEGQHRILLFATEVHNRGDQDLVIGNPANSPDIFEPAAHMPSGWITKEKLYEYTLKNSTGEIVTSGFKRAWCIQDHTPKFDCENQGISVGDHDEYNTDQNCQFLVIDNLEDGEYLFEVIVNQSRIFNEDNYDDNNVIKNLKIHGISVREL